MINDLSWSGESVTATLVSRIDQTMKVELRGQYVEDIELKAGVPADHFFLVLVPDMCKKGGRCFQNIFLLFICNVSGQKSQIGCYFRSF